MKKHITLLFLITTIITSLYSQTTVIIDSKQYKELKKQGKLNSSVVLKSPPIHNFTRNLNDEKKAPATHHTPGSSDCSCYITPDNTYTLAMQPNDDESSSLIHIPFTFCLYGNNYTDLYINNNGNISFGTPYYTFSSNPFPDPSFIMVAPFWADVDTYGTGSVKYKITPTAMFINWDGVGYYDSHTDKVNTFQLTITDGNDPILPPGNNIAFCYGDMQWTTGDASDGTNGFGGTIEGASPATVGVNKGDGTNYIQIGRFAYAGAAYDGGYGADDGVSWLDNKSFYFNSCAGSNIAPIVSGLNNCDTIHICNIGDTLILNALFLAPELGQTTTISVALNGTPNASVLNITNGNSATAQVQIIATLANIGNNVITFTATDNGTPVGTTIVNANVFVDTIGISNFNPVISGNLSLCGGQNTTLSVSPTNYDSYYWNTGSVGTSITVDSSGQYWVTAIKDGCYKTDIVDVAVHSLPTPVITGYPFTCSGSTTTLTVDSLIYTSYLWSNSNTNDSITVGNGTYTVMVTDSNGCTATSPAVTVATSNPTVSIVGNHPFCPGDTVILTAISSPTTGANYLWSTSATTPSIVVNSAGQYIINMSYTSGCTATDSTVVSLYNTPNANFTTSPLNMITTLAPVSFTDLSTVTPGTIINWNWNFGVDGNSVSTLQNPTYTYNVDGVYTVTLAVQSSNGCWDTVRSNYTVTFIIQIPNVVTPNNGGNSGLNNLFYIKNLEHFPGTALTVFNRWGNKIYESKDYQNNWNCDKNPAGVYYYILQGPKLKETMYGFFQIIR